MDETKREEMVPLCGISLWDHFAVSDARRVGVGCQRRNAKASGAAALQHPTFQQANH